MAGEASGVPNSGDLPSSWPGAYRAEAEQVGAALLAEWDRRAREHGRRFAVLYVPRGVAQLTGQVAVADTWWPWLRETCAELGIPLVDSSPVLESLRAAGTAPFDDHFTPEAHVAVAELLAESLVDAP